MHNINLSRVWKTMFLYMDVNLVMLCPSCHSTNNGRSYKQKTGSQQSYLIHITAITVAYSHIKSQFTRTSRYSTHQYTVARHIMATISDSD